MKRASLAKLTRGVVRLPLLSVFPYDDVFNGFNTAQLAPATAYDSNTAEQSKTMPNTETGG